MHQVHPVTEFGEGEDDARRVCLTDAGEHQEGSCREADHVQGAEGPSYFKFRGGVDYSRDGLDVEG